MIKEFSFAWENNKDKLEDHFETHVMGEYEDYISLIQLLFDIVINPEMDWRFITTMDAICTIDNGDYQGTLVFILHKGVYQPSVGDYVYTSVNYGSCSGCDTIQGIHQYDYDEFPDEDQVKDYMSLCLHLLEKCHYLE